MQNKLSIEKMCKTLKDTLFSKKSLNFKEFDSIRQPNILPQEEFTQYITYNKLGIHRS